MQWVDDHTSFSRSTQPRLEPVCDPGEGERNLPHEVVQTNLVMRQTMKSNLLYRFWRMSLSNGTALPCRQERKLGSSGRQLQSPFSGPIYWSTGTHHCLDQVVEKTKTPSFLSARYS